MQKTHIRIAVIAMAASLSLLAACSKEEDKNAVPESAPPMTNPAPSDSAPAPMPAPAPSPAPSDTTPAPSSGSLDQAKESAKQAGNAIADKAGELKDSAAKAASNARDAVKEGAASADKAIQNKLGNGSTVNNPDTPPQSGS